MDVIKKVINIGTHSATSEYAGSLRVIDQLRQSVLRNDLLWKASRIYSGLVEAIALFRMKNFYIIIMKKSQRSIKPQIYNLDV